jgi:hypothetical protein
MGNDYEPKTNKSLADGDISKLASAILEALKDISKEPLKPLETHAQLAANTFQDIIGGLGIGRGQPTTDIPGPTQV